MTPLLVAVLATALSGAAVPAAAMAAPGAPAAKTAAKVMPSLAVPPAPKRAPAGSEIVGPLVGKPSGERQDGLAAAVQAGNIPRFLRELVPVRYEAADAAGIRHTVELAVTPDYLAVGNNADFLRVALDGPHAQAAARLAGGFLPTRYLVDRIYEAAAVKVSPQPIPPSAAMVTLRVLLDHRELLRGQDLSRPSPLLRAGHKKDVVLTPRLVTQPDRVAIYGWHRPGGAPIQPLSLVHVSGYADYSHGVRVVSRSVRVDGAPRDLGELLCDPVSWSLVGNEGPLPRALVQ